MSGQARLKPVESGAAGSGKKPYPGESSCAASVFLLAEEYRLAACILRKALRSGEHLSRAPYRLAAIHAIELYLNALLLAGRHEPAFIRGLQHDLSARADRAAALGLCLRKRTIEHLRELARAREYLLTRYDPEGLQKLSQINRLDATLEEIRRKVGQRCKLGS